MDPVERRRAERHLVAVLRRVHRSDPLRPGMRIDTLIEQVRSAAGRTRPSSHRGSAPLNADDDDLRAIIDGMASRGQLMRTGRLVALPEHRTELAGEMQGRVDRLLAELRSSGPNTAPADARAARLGIPPAVMRQLRTAGILVSVAPRIDYPREVVEALNARINRLAEAGPITIVRIRDELGLSRRHAAALLERYRASGRGAEPR